MSKSPVINNEFNAEQIRQDFPILQQLIHNKPLIYLDNAGTTQKPQTVIDAIQRFYQQDYAAVHRGVHTLSERATALYEQAREVARQFLNAKKSQEIIFVRGTTEAINLVAQSYGRSQLQAGDEIIISEMEHHSNIVPWQLVCEQTGAVLRIIPFNEAGELDIKAYQQLFTARTKLVAVVHLSNVLGTINPIKEMIAYAHQYQVPVLIDGAQAVGRLITDVQDLDCDFYAFSGHKIYGPSGIGVLYGKQHLLEAMPPYQGGGAMIRAVHFDKSLYSELPHKFEAGTPSIADTIGLTAALNYVNSIGINAIHQHEQQLLRYAIELLQTIPGLRMIGTAKNRASVISFTLEGIHPHDIGTILDSHGIAIRSGHHCAMPVMEHFKVPATARASFGIYNTKADVDALVAALQQVHEVFH